MKPKYLKLWEDWEAPEEWEDPGIGDLGSSGLLSDPFKGLEKLNREDPDLWGNPYWVESPDGLIEISQRLDQVVVEPPIEVRVGKEQGIIRRSTPTLGLLFHPDTLELVSLIIGQSYTNTAGGKDIEISWTWCGEKGPIDFSRLHGILTSGIRRNLDNWQLIVVPT